MLVNIEFGSKVTRTTFTFIGIIKNIHFLMFIHNFMLS